MLKRSFIAATIIGAFAVSVVLADSTLVKGFMSFNPITSSAYEELTNDTAVLNGTPWIVPAGFTQSIVSDESALNIYSNNDWSDSNTVNETGKQLGRYLYRTHEVSPRASSLETYTGGAISVVDLQTGTTTLLLQRRDWEALDGIVWTPWGSLLVTEEVGTALLGDPQAPTAIRGLVYEVELDPRDPTRVTNVSVRPMLGSMTHEGIELDADGNVYVIDEFGTGAIYKFVPANYGDLSSGQLYALKVDDSQTGDRTGPAQWVALDMNVAQMDGRAAALNAGATSYGRPEDVERIENTLYVAITGEARVLSIGLGAQPQVGNFVKAGLNTPVENQSASVTGFRSPDNLANGADGKLWIVEDNTPSDIWVAMPDSDGDGASDAVHLFASLRDTNAEGSGIYFGKDRQTLFVNVQHSVTGNDKTVAITNRN
jgi:sugar lactone lactonase YvrE